MKNESGHISVFHNESHGTKVKCFGKRQPYILLNACYSGTIQKLPFGVNKMIDFENVTTSDNTDTLLVEKYPARWHYCLM
jgi:hypothetical protein